MTYPFEKSCPKTGFPSEALLAYAARFDILLTDVQADQARLSILTPCGWQHVWLPSKSLAGRMLAELGSRTAPWVLYKVGTPCLDTLMARSPAQIDKLVEHYQAHKTQSGFRPDLPPPTVASSD